MKKKGGAKKAPKAGGSQVAKTVLERIEANAAGIDVGSREHYVAVPADRDAQPVRVFGCLTPDLEEMAAWLELCKVTTVVMESTGVYWVPVLQVLIQHGLDVKLVNAAHVKNVPGRKSDVQDCQWLQELHTFGLLRGAFIPDDPIQVLRGYWRHRACLVEQRTQQTQRMLKAMEQMNIQLGKKLSDITGLTGMTIIRAIIAGERDGVKLAQMKHPSVHSSEEELAKALTGNWRAEQLFALKQSVELYDFIQVQIRECDKATEAYLKTFESKADPKNLEERSNNKRGNSKNGVRFDLRSELYRITGTDLTKINGIDVLTAHTLISEVGIDMSRFPSEKHFCSWLGLCPNNKITGGRVISSHTRHVVNRAATALRVAAQCLHRSDSGLGALYRRKKGQKSAPEAITIAAHAMARQVYRMLKYGEGYVDQGQKAYEERQKERELKYANNLVKPNGYIIINRETGEVVS